MPISSAAPPVCWWTSGPRWCPSGWRIARRPGRDTLRAKDLLAWDLDAAEEHYAGAEWVKVQVCGPWTLAAGLELPSGHRALTDAGAVSTTSPSR